MTEQMFQDLEITAIKGIKTGVNGQAIWEEAFASRNDLVARQKSEMAEQKDAARPAGRITSEFGKLELLGSEINLKQVVQEAGGQSTRTLGTRVENGKVIEIVQQENGEVADIYPKDGESQKIVFYKDLDASKKRQPDRVETVWDAGRGDGQYKSVQYTNPEDHEGVRTIRQFEGRSDGLTYREEYTTESSRNVMRGNPPRLGCYMALQYDSDKNENGLREERIFNSDISGGVKSEREYNPEKNGGCVIERTLSNGKVVRIDANGKVLGQSNDRPAPSPEPGPGPSDTDNDLED